MVVVQVVCMVRAHVTELSHPCDRGIHWFLEHLVYRGSPGLLWGKPGNLLPLYKILRLCLDGGGMLGLFSSQTLRVLESLDCPNASVTEYFLSTVVESRGLKSHQVQIPLFSSYSFSLCRWKDYRGFPCGAWWRQHMQ